MKRKFSLPAACLLCAQIFIACGGDKQGGGSAASSAAPATGPASAAQNAAPGAKEYAAPSEYAPNPFKVGQWARFRTSLEGEAPGEMIYRIVSQEGSAFWLEAEMKLPTGISISQTLMEFDPKMEMRADTVKKARIKLPNGQIQEFPPSLVQSMAAPLLNQLYGKPFGDPAKAPRGDASSPAGHFKGCFIQEEERALLNTKIRTKTWSHPAVPIAGIVRSEGVYNGKNMTSELLEFSETGAKSSF